MKTSSSLWTACCYKLLYPFAILLLIFSPLSASFAETITIKGLKIIDQSTCYRNATINLDEGAFLVTNNATLQFVNSKISGTLSPQNPFLLHLSLGQLVMSNSTLQVATQDIEPIPENPSAYHAIRVSQGKVYMVNNKLSISSLYTAGLLVTGYYPTSNFIFKNNRISGFHGGIFLSNSSHAEVSNNQFSKVSMSNILTKNGSYSTYRHNTMIFSGNNGIDILDSNNITFSENQIYSSSCYSIFVLRSQDIILQANSVIGGKTYAIYIAPTIGTGGMYSLHLKRLVDDEIQDNKVYKNNRILIIANYLAQNRYGLAATNVNDLEVSGNVFVQHFANDSQRKFWTNNDVLLSDTAAVTWNNNLYKEAFPQNMSAPADPALKFVAFPLHGGASI